MAGEDLEEYQATNKWAISDIKNNLVATETNLMSIYNCQILQWVHADDVITIFLSSKSTGSMAQAVEHLPCKHEALSLKPQSQPKRRN
jgi:hypothetical protein